jgi:N-acetyl-anhydromuramyl-L-alanine amidase AmpD
MQAMRSDLARLGYQIDAGDFMDAEVRSVILAFQRHWQPDHLTGARDPLTRWRLDAVLNALAISRD